MNEKEQDHIASLLERAFALYHDQRMNNALDILKIVLEMHPRSGKAHALLGFIYEVAGDMQRALQSFRSAIRYGFPKTDLYGKLLEVWEYDRIHNKPEEYAHIKEYINNNKRYVLYDIGDYSYCPSKDMDVGDWFTGETLVIGKFCSIATGVSILLGGEHSLQCISTYNFNIGFHDHVSHNDCLSKGDVHIGNDVWIGYGSTILSGVHIGDGAAVGAKSVVTKDIKPYGIAAGNPARIIGSRFDRRGGVRIAENKMVGLELR